MKTNIQVDIDNTFIEKDWFKLLSKKLHNNKHLQISVDKDSIWIHVDDHDECWVMITKKGITFGAPG